MKTFILKLLSFAFFLLLYLGINNIINRSIFQHSDFPIDCAKIIISGDSHLQRSLKPALLPSAVNISQSAEPYAVTYWKLRYIFQHCKPEILILGFSHHNISAYNDMKFWDKKWSSEMFKRSYMIGDFRSLRKLKIDYKEYLKIYVEQMCLYPHTHHFNFLGGYNNNHNNNSDLSHVEQAIQRHFYYGNEKVGISNTAIAYLEDIIHLCEKNNVFPLLISSPVHEEYFRLVPPAITEKYEYEKNRLMKQNILVLDFTQEHYQNSLFLNADHLNEKGALQFTDRIALVLKNMKEN